MRITPPLNKLRMRLAEAVGLDVEVLDIRGNVYYEVLDSFELYENGELIFTLRTQKGPEAATTVFNFRHIIYIRAKQGSPLEPTPIRVLPNV